jgi:exopolysaccharide biosynthesis operon protein EpsL
MFPSLRKNIDSSRIGRYPAPSKTTLTLTPLVLLIGALFSTPALADLSDTLHPYLATSVNYDDNLLRLSDTELASRDGASDTYRTVVGGLLLERPIERQFIKAQAKFSKVSFDRFSQLDYSGKDLSAEWKWQLGNHFDGHLGGVYVQTIAPFSDFHDDEKSLRTRRMKYFDGNWRFHPSWQVHTGFQQEEYNYELTSQRFNNRQENRSEAGIDYLAPSGSKVGLLLRRVKDEYPVQLASFSSDFQQDEVDLNVFWALSGETNVMFVGGYVKHKHTQGEAREVGGVNGRVIANWQPLGKLQFTGMAWREFGAAENTIVQSALSKGASIASIWNATAKIKVQALLSRENRDFTPLSGLVDVSGLTDSTRMATLGVTYHPWRKGEISLNAFHTSRDGSVSGGTTTYSANGASLNASVQF